MGAVSFNVFYIILEYQVIYDFLNFAFFFMLQNIRYINNYFLCVQIIVIAYIYLLQLSFQKYLNF